MLLLTNENYTSTLHSEIDAFLHMLFTATCRYLLQRYIKFTRFHITKEKMCIFCLRFALGCQNWRVTPELSDVHSSLRTQVSGVAHPRVFRSYALLATRLIEWRFTFVECHFSVVEWPFRIVEWPFRNVKRHSTTLKGCSTRKSLRARVYIHDSWIKIHLTFPTYPHPTFSVG